MPSLSPSRSVLREPGVISSRTPGATFFPFRIAAATLKSSSRPLVLVPMKTWLTASGSTVPIGCTLSTKCGQATMGSRVLTSKFMIFSYAASGSACSGRYPAGLPMLFKKRFGHAVGIEQADLGTAFYRHIGDGEAAGHGQ